MTDCEIACAGIAIGGRHKNDRPSGVMCIFTAAVPALLIALSEPASARIGSDTAVIAALPMPTQQNPQPWPSTETPNSDFASSDVGQPSEGIEKSEIVVRARQAATAGDPYQAINAKSFAIAQHVDDAVVGPVAIAYKRSIPKPVRDGLQNFLNNTREPVIIISFLLEFKPGKASETLGRLAINSTLGFAGLFDIAKRKPFRLPRRRNGLADVLGYHGVKSGPFFFLPLIGPTTLRDVIGGSIDRLLLPLAVGTPFNNIGYAVGTGIVSGLNRRLEFDNELERIRHDAPNPYVARRDLYLRERAEEIDGLHSGTIRQAK